MRASDLFARERQARARRKTALDRAPGTDSRARGARQQQGCRLLYRLHAWFRAVLVAVARLERLARARARLLLSNVLRQREGAARPGFRMARCRGGCPDGPWIAFARHCPVLVRRSRRLIPP